MDRRQFIGKTAVAAATTVAAGTLLEACQSNSNQTSPSNQGEGDQGGEVSYRTGLHGEKVSILGYGCMRWPTLPNGQVQQDGPAKGSDIDQEAVNRLIDYAMEHGVNYYDTSPVYCKGYSEQSTGIALARYPRDSYMVATKMSNFDPVLWPREESIRMYHNSMKYLQVDYIDFYLLHAVGGGGMDSLHKRFLDNGVLDFLLAEREAGRIRNLGFSYHGDIEVFDWLLANNDKYHWDFVQIQHNYVDWNNSKSINQRNTDSEYLYGELEKRGIPAVIMEPLLGGRLAKLNRHATAQLKAIEPEQSVASWAFRFAATQPGVLTVLSGMTYMDHLQDNLKTYSPLHPVNEQEQELLKRIAHELATFPTVPCTGCQYCMPCPYGIDIPGVFKHYNTCLDEGLVQDDTQSPDFRRLRKAYLKSYSLIERERQADHCIGCGKCVSHCPQRINIPAQMQRIDRYEQTLRESL